MRIPISSQDLLFGTKVHEYNIFFLFMVIFSPILVLGLRYRLRSMKDHHCGERLLQPGLFTAFIYLYSALFGCALATEHYWHLSCPVSTARFHVTTQIFQHNLAFLASSEWADTAFVAEGTMLAVVRERPNLNIWDQDSDIFVAIEAADETSVLQTLEKLRKELMVYYQKERPGVMIEAHPERWLVQVYDPSGGHGDIWLWQRRAVDGAAVIYSPDFTYAGLAEPQGGYSHFLKWVLPTSEITWNGVKLPVANNYHAMLKNQYGSSYMEPYMNRFQCLENFGTKLFPSALFWFYMAVILLYTIAFPQLMKIVADHHKGQYMQLPQQAKGRTPKYSLTKRHLALFTVLLALVLYGFQFVIMAQYDTTLEIPNQQSENGEEGGPLTQEQLERYRTDGFLVLRAKEWLTDVEREKVMSWTEEVQNWPEKKYHWMKYFEDSSINGNRILNRVENYIPYHDGLQEMFNASGSKVMRMLHQLQGGKCVLYKDKINMKLPGGGGFEPHQDVLAGWGSYNVSNFVTFSVSVDHAHETNGALEIVAGQHKRGKLGDDWSPLAQSVVDGMEWKLVETFPGDAVIFDAYVPHRSAPNGAEKSRRNLYLTYNLEHEGDHRLSYYKSKRQNYPPDIEREPGKKYEYKV